MKRSGREEVLEVSPPSIEKYGTGLAGHALKRAAARLVAAFPPLKVELELGLRSVNRGTYFGTVAGLYRFVWIRV